MQRFLYCSCIIVLLIDVSFADSVQYETAYDSKRDTARITLHFSFSSGGVIQNASGLSLELSIYDKEQTVAGITIQYFQETDDTLSCKAVLPIQIPKLWNAERPYFYILQWRLKQNETIVREGNEQIGLRDVRIENGRLEVNHVPVKLRGVSYTIPDATGEALSEAIAADFAWMKQANSNALLVHQENADDGFLAFCDKAGMYLVYANQESKRTQQYQSHPSFTAVVRFKNDKVNTFLPALSKLQNPSLRDAMTVAAQPVPSLVVNDSPLNDVETLQTIVEGQDRIAGVFFGSFDGLMNDTSEKKLRFYELQRLFSPIQIREYDRNIITGPQTIDLTLSNHFDFANLLDIDCTWTLVQNRKTIQTGSMLFNLPPHRVTPIAVDCTIPDNIVDYEYFLNLDFKRNEGESIYTHTVRLRPKQWKEAQVLRFRDMPRRNHWTVEETGDYVRFAFQDYCFYIKDNGFAFGEMKSSQSTSVFARGPYLNSASLEEIENATLATEIDVKWAGHAISYASDFVMCKTKWNFLIEKKSIPSNIDFYFSPYGFIDVIYEIEPENLPSDFLELGLAFSLPFTVESVGYNGLGPFASYPGQAALNRFGIHYLVRSSPFFCGNRSQVDLAAFLDKKRKGIGLLLFDGDVSWYRDGDSLRIGINSLVRGFNEDIQRKPQIGHSECTAKFRLFPIQHNKPPKIVQEILAGK